MKRKMTLFLFLSLTALLCSPLLAGTLSWDPVNQYSDSAPIDTFKDVRYLPYTGLSDPPDSKGTPVVNSLSAPVPDPAPGQTMYYSVTATVVGEEIESEKAAAVSKTAPFKVPAAPSGLTVQ